MIGIDIEKIERFKDETILEKIALENELAYIAHFKNRKEKIASLWAVKEAVFKALGSLTGVFFHKQIELCHEESGKPYVILSGEAKEILGDRQIEVSISHDEDTVCAVAIITK